MVATQLQLTWQDVDGVDIALVVGQRRQVTGLAAYPRAPVEDRSLRQLQRAFGGLRKQQPRDKLRRQILRRIQSFGEPGTSERMAAVKLDCLGQKWVTRGGHL